MKIYNEKEKVEQVKKYLRKKQIPRQNGDEFSVLGDKPGKKWNKGSDDHRKSFHPAKLPTCINE